MGQWDQAVSDFGRAVQYAKQLSYWRGLTQVDGSLAKVYLHQGALPSALNAIDEAIDANERIPEELYFVPRNLAIKAEITARMGNLKASNDLYEKSADVIDALLRKVPTPTIERLLLAQLSEVYSGYFASLGDQGRDADAFHVIERARGRVEAEHLANHEIVTPHDPSPAEQRVTKLNLELLNTDNSAARTHILDSIYESEKELNPSLIADAPPAQPVDLVQLQKDLSPSELFIEYVLSEPQSYALAVTHESVRRYPLPSKDVLEQQATVYRFKIVHQKTDLSLAQQLFDGLLKGIPEYKQKQKIVVVPDGKLHLLSFPALANDGKYVLISHRVTVVPSGTVLHLLRRRAKLTREENLPYIGVAAWTTNAPSKTFLASILRAVSGPKRSELVALPESQHEVEAIAADLPKPSTILLGALATKTAFKQLPLSHYRVIHLALHGYADAEYPDRSALVFAPQPQAADDGLLQVREIRSLALNANLVTLSACDTGVGPVGEAGVANIVNAFIEAGAMSVVSTLWELEDHATAHLMTTFYEHLSRHEEKADALREAQLEMLQSGSVPYYWAGFMLNGEPDGSLFRETEVGVPARSNR